MTSIFFFQASGGNQPTRVQSGILILEPPCKQPLLYNLSVTKEFFKQIYVKEGLQPPSLDVYRTAYTSLWTQVMNPGLVGTVVRSGGWVVWVFTGYRLLVSSRYICSFFIMSQNPVLIWQLARLEKLLDNEVWLATSLIIRATGGTGDQ